MAEVARGDAYFNIEELIHDVPTATIVSGNPTVSVRVEVAKEYADRLCRAVEDTCTVGTYRYLEVY